MKKLILARWAIALVVGLIMPAVIFMWNEPDRVCSATEEQTIKAIDSAMRSGNPISGGYPNCAVDHVMTVSEVRTEITGHLVAFVLVYLFFASVVGWLVHLALWILVGAARLSVVLARSGAVKLKAVSA